MADFFHRARLLDRQSGLERPPGLARRLSDRRDILLQLIFLTPPISGCP
jgi:hypothetical protein